MTDHDPMCPLFDKVNYPFAAACGCDLIARVRANERAGKPDPGIDERQAYALAEAYKNGREQGQRDEREAAAQRVEAEAETIRAEYDKPTHRLRIKIVDRLVAAARGEASA